MREVCLFILVMFCFVLQSCGLLGTGKNSSELVVNKDAELVLKEKKVAVKEGEGVQTPTEAFLVQSPGYVPVFVIPAKDEFQKNNLNLSPLSSDMLDSEFQKTIQEKLSEALFAIHQAQNEIFEKDYANALKLIEEAEVKYGSMTYFSYMKASIYYLRGNKPKLKDLIDSLSKEERENKHFKPFLRLIN